MVSRLSGSAITFRELAAGASVALLPAWWILAAVLLVAPFPALSAEPPAPPAPAAVPPAPAKPAASRKKVATWQIGQLRVLSPGTFKKLPEGRFTEGYTVTAPARAVGDVPFADGTFTMTIASFTPDKDMPRQPTGSWYVKGAWRLVRTGSKVPAGARHSPEALAGQLVAKLPLDPVTGKGGWSVTLRTPKGATFGDLKNVAGTFTVSETLDGSLFLQMEEDVSRNSQ